MFPTSLVSKSPEKEFTVAVALTSDTMPPIHASTHVRALTCSSTIKVVSRATALTTPTVARIPTNIKTPATPMLSRAATLMHSKITMVAVHSTNNKEAPAMMTPSGETLAMVSYPNIHKWKLV